MLLAQYVALTDAALLYAAHQAVPLIIVSAAVALVAAYRFFDGLIEELETQASCWLLPAFSRS